MTMTWSVDEHGEKKRETSVDYSRIDIVQKSHKGKSRRKIRFQIRKEKESTERR